MSVHAPLRRPAPAPAAPMPAVVPDPVYRPAAAEERLRALRSLSHYLEGYPYQPHYEYTETFTTDPHYIREHVDLMPPGDPHSYYLTHLVNAFGARIDRLLRYVSREVAIGNIPPALLEVVSHASDEVRDNDRVVKRRNYARMGVREYWLLDTEEPETPLEGFRLTRGGVDYTPASAVYDPYAPVPADMAYAPLPAVDDGWRSAVLGAALRWDPERRALQRRDDKRGLWDDVYVLPEVAEARGEAKGRLEGHRKLAVELLVRMVRRHGTLPPARLAAYRAELEARTRLPDFDLIQERLLGFPPADRAAVVASFVETGFMPSPTDNGGGTW